VSPKRGDRVAPPAKPGRYVLKFATNEAAKAWEHLCSQAPGNTRAAYETIESNPCPMPPTDRQHQLKGQLAIDCYRGEQLPQWQYEVTGAGRIWYLVDHHSLICWSKEGHYGPPKNHRIAHAVPISWRNRGLDVEAQGPQLLPAFLSNLVRAPRGHPHPVDPYLLDQPTAGSHAQRLLGLVLDDVSERAGG
jgi:hypothetical protein